MSLIVMGVIALAVLGGLALLVAFTLRRVVPTNMVDIVQYKSKTVSYGNSAGSNVYYQWPSFLPMLGVTVTRLPVSVFKVTLKDYASYDSGRLPFLVDVAAFFRVSDSNIAAQRVSSYEELKTQLLSILEGAVRVTLAQHKLEEIMQDRAVLGETFTKNVQDTLGEWGVATVQDIQFMDLRDVPESTVIHNIMSKEQSRILRESRETVAENNRAAKEKEIAAQRQIQLQEQEAIEQVGIRTATQDKQVGIAQQLAQQEILEQSKTTAEREMEVKQVNEVRGAEIARSVAEIAAQQARDVTVVNADAEKQRLTVVADGELVAATKEAEAVRVRGEAEAAAKAAFGLAEIQPQITLAEQIGENNGYQTYLVEVRKIEATEAVGKEMAGALKAADIKVIANGGTVDEGMNGIAGLLSSKGGTQVASMLEGFMQSETGSAIVEKALAATAPKPARRTAN